MIEKINNYPQEIDTTDIAKDLNVLKQDILHTNERYVIPPIIKDVYQKFINIKTKDDIANIVFSDLERTALKAENSEFRNEKYQTGFFGKKMYKSLKKVFPELQQTLQQRQEAYSSEHPEKKLSPKESEILANPIEIKDIRVAIGNESYIFTKISLAGEDIAISKPIKENNQSESRYYDVWSVYYPSKKSPLMISETPSGVYLEDIHQERLRGRFLIGVDGNLYAIDEEMKVMQKDGMRKSLTWNKGYARYEYDTNMYKGFRSGECTKSGSEYVVSIQYDGNKITYQQQESKKDRYIALYQQYAKDHNLEYTLVYKDDGTCCLEKNGIMSICSEHILSYTNETFIDRIEQASQNIEEKIDRDTKETSAPEKKLKVFEGFANKYCSDVKVGESGPFTLKKDYLPDGIPEGKYGLSLGYLNNEPNNEVYLKIIDMSSNPFQEVKGSWTIFRITDKYGNRIEVDEANIEYYIKYYISDYEKNKNTGQ